MSKRFAQVSKYRHAVGKANKRENWYAEIQPTACATEASNGLACSTQWIVYRTGANLGLLDLHHSADQNRPGRQLATIPATNATDFDFSPFDSHLLVSGNETGQIILWRIDDGESIDKPTASTVSTLACPSRRIESVLFHPTASHVVCAASNQNVYLWNADRSEPILTLTGHDDVIQSLSWRDDGTTLATTCRDSVVRIFDPRTSSSNPVVSGEVHASHKSSRVLWLGSKDYLFTTGFSKTRQREYALFDVRKGLGSSLQKTQLDSSPSLLIPMYDQDTNIVYMVGRGDTAIKSVEVGENPVFTEGAPTYTKSSLMGAALTPKRCLNVMEGEIARVQCLTNEGLIPVSFNVPRRTYTTFHSDLYPDTKSNVAALTADDWFGGKNGEVLRISLDPINKNLIQGDLATTKIETKLSTNLADLNINQPEPANVENSEPAGTGQSPTPSSVPTRKSSTESYRFTNVRQSAFRYLSGKPMHIRESFQDIRNLSYSLSGESNVLEANSKFVAFPISGSGGRIAVALANKPSRFSPVIPSIVAGSEVNDFSLSKTDPNLMCTASEDSKLRLWRIPDSGLVEDLQEPACILSGHMNRVNMCGFHPFVSNLLLSSSPEQMSIGGQSPTVRLWDLNAKTEVRKFESFEDMVLGYAWSMDGHGRLVTASKDKKLRIFDVRSKQVIAEGPSHDGQRACRIIWADDKLITVGFGKGSQREMAVYDTKNMASGPSFTLPIDVSPSVLVPHFDEDSKIIYLCGRGDTNIIPVEWSPNEATPLTLLPRFESANASIQQGIVFWPKSALDVRSVEIARCWRLTQNSVEPISFTVPRNRKEFFQDDLYPLSRDATHATMTAAEFFETSKDVVPEPTINLLPPTMTKLSEAPVEVKPEPKYRMPTGERLMTDTERQQKFLNEIFTVAKGDDQEEEILPQDQMEGVDSDEWDD